MKLKDLKDAVSMNTNVIIENRDKQPLLHGYLEWFMNTGLENREIISINAEQNTLHIMIEMESEQYESRRSIS